eukprot:CAMPEP_0177534142 /NCGR_PEP_ID=MMETSP0369-20130122/55753_1 /TAXON_ID=447022 ORGANISM="Scrippsiella hangoei-like, Strain SHHI-4" /NCGR_SAMPLE_ID=MMETSP0369 /ASSEMBLY_ACC=CAM_ASM_000364 /LENGTH=103 /DNA_ID=CAMNT_0019016001 /DNA_START=282 /DNA_END=590 /DNA_ORIENTATION=+
MPSKLLAMSMRLCVSGMIGQPPCAFDAKLRVKAETRVSVGNPATSVELRALGPKTVSKKQPIQQGDVEFLGPQVPKQSCAAPSTVVISRSLRQVLRTDVVDRI